MTALRSLVEATRSFGIGEVLVGRPGLDPGTSGLKGTCEL